MFSLVTASSHLLSNERSSIPKGCLWKHTFLPKRTWLLPDTQVELTAPFFCSYCAHTVFYCSTQDYSLLRPYPPTLLPYQAVRLLQTGVMSNSACPSPGLRKCKRLFLEVDVSSKRGHLVIQHHSCIETLSLSKSLPDSGILRHPHKAHKRLMDTVRYHFTQLL